LEAADRRLTPAEREEADRLANRRLEVEQFQQIHCTIRLVDPSVVLLVEAIDRPKEAASRLVLGNLIQFDLLLALMDCLYPPQPVAPDARWGTADVVGLLRGMHEEHAYDRLPILADALMDAGCENEDVLGHCRSRGPHTSDCWVVELFRPARAARPRHPRVVQGLEILARYSGPMHPNLQAFAQTGILRDESHKAAVLAELADLSGALASLPEARPLAWLLGVMPSAPLRVCIYK
jgi:hypothetical protein